MTNKISDKNDKSIGNLDHIRNGYFNIPIKDNPDADLVWKTLITRQLKNLEGKATKEFFRGLDLLQLDTEHIPKVGHLDKVVKENSGFSVSLTDVEYTDAEGWFKHLAGKNCLVTTFIRSKENLDFTLFPDMFHDVFGHIPLMTSPRIASIAERFGHLFGTLKSEKKKIELANLWWFSIEFGLIKENGQLRALGTGLMSSSQELAGVFDGKVKMEPFEQRKVANTDSIAHELNKKLFVLESFDHLEDELTKWEKELE